MLRTIEYLRIIAYLRTAFPSNDGSWRKKNRAKFCKRQQFLYGIRHKPNLMKSMLFISIFILILVS